MSQELNFPDENKCDSVWDVTEYPCFSGVSVTEQVSKTQKQCLHYKQKYFCVVQTDSLLNRDPTSGH